MSTIININLLLAACEHTIVFPLSERANPKSEMTHCL